MSFPIKEFKDENEKTQLRSNIYNQLLVFKTKKPRFTQQDCNEITNAIMALIEAKAHWGYEACEVKTKARDAKLHEKIEEFEIYHKSVQYDGESDCIEVWNANHTIISDVACFEQNGKEIREFVKPKAEAQKEAEVEKCDTCEFIRELKALLLV